MRRGFLCWGVMCLVCWSARSATAQFYQQRSNYHPPIFARSGAAPPAVQDDDKRERAASEQAAQNNGPRVELRHPHPTPDRNDRRPGGILILGVPSVPYYWPSGYTPAFPPFAPYMTPPPIVQDPAIAPEPPAPAQDPEPAPRKPPGTTPEQKAKAGKFIGYGDANFAQQKFLDAADRYRTAAQTAGDLPEAHLRYGFALVASGQYRSAAKAFRKALAIRSDWSASPLSLDQLYGDNQIAKTAHLENLAKAVEVNELDATMLMVLGIELHFDKQRDRAATFLSRAVELGISGATDLNELLGQPAGDSKDQGGKIVF